MTLAEAARAAMAAPMTDTIDVTRVGPLAWRFEGELVARWVGCHWTAICPTVTLTHVATSVTVRSAA